MKEIIERNIFMNMRKYVVHSSNKFFFIEFLIKFLIEFLILLLELA